MLGSFVLLLAPILTLVAIATQSSGDLWPHLISYVLPRSFSQTALMLAGVTVIVTSVGTGSAWLVTAYDFPLRRVFEWALLLPLAIPTYIIAFAYLDLMHPPIGPVRTDTLRATSTCTHATSAWRCDHCRAASSCWAWCSTPMSTYSPGRCS